MLFHFLQSTRESTPEAEIEGADPEGEKPPTPVEMEETLPREEPEPPAPTPPEPTPPTPQPTPQPEPNPEPQPEIQPEPQPEVVPESEIQATPSPEPKEQPNPASTPTVGDETEIESPHEDTPDPNLSNVHEITPRSDAEMESLHLVLSTSHDITPSYRPASPILALTPSVSRVEKPTEGTGLETSTEGEPSDMFERFDVDVSFRVKGKTIMLFKTN